jgi:hypothetical protein
MLALHLHDMVLQHLVDPASWHAQQLLLLFCNAATARDRCKCRVEVAVGLLRTCMVS